MNAGNTAYTDTGTFYANAGVDVERIDDAITTILGEAPKDRGRPGAGRGAREGAVTRRDVSCCDSRARRGRSSTASAARYSRSAIEEPDELLRRLDEVTVEDVQRVARDLFEEKRLYLALVGPFDDPDHFEKLLAA